MQGKLNPLEYVPGNHESRAPKGPQQFMCEVCHKNVTRPAHVIVRVWACYECEGRAAK